MVLKPGQTFGPFEVNSLLGRGGMGEVYLARDSRLDRQVALKVLTADRGLDEGRIQRFRREAKVLASLDHARIGRIYGSEEIDGQTVLVLEHVAGDDLSDQIARGPLPLQTALPLAHDIACALERAHEQGIVHRDLKPSNIKITEDGRAKVLDFGLARITMSGTELSQSAEEAEPSTLTQLTREGQVLGTLDYMSPEQIRGEVVDRRTDIWSFGCVVYEVLTGAPPFRAGSTGDSAAAILTQEPDWDRLPRNTPVALRRTLARALRKDPERRLRDIGDARLEIEEASEPAGPDPVEGPAPVSVSRRPWTLATVLALVPLALVGGWWLRGRAVDDPGHLVYAQWNLEDGQRLSGYWEETNFNQRPTRTAAALSPDGQTLATSAYAEGGSVLLRRRLDEPRFTRLPGTAGADSPFFSPDGRWIGFSRPAVTPGPGFAGPRYEIMKVAVGGGSPQRVAVHENDTYLSPFGISWGEGIIVYAGAYDLYRVDDSEGAPSVLARADLDAGQTALRLPHFLPNGRHLLYTVQRGEDWSRAEIWWMDVETGERRLLLVNGADARFSPTGHLLFGREGQLMAAAFDPAGLQLRGEALVVLDDLMQAQYSSSTGRSSGAAQFTLGPEGRLLFAPGGVDRRPVGQILKIAPDGETELLPFSGSNPRLSPDESRLAYLRGSEIWVRDLRRGSGGLEEPVPGEPIPWFIWGPRGDYLVFASNRDGPWSIYRIAADGSGEAETVLRTGEKLIPSSWSLGGWLTFLVDESDIWVVEIQSRADRLEVGEPRPFFESEHTERFPQLSPDERWMVYSSNKIGRWEVYVRPFPAAEPEIRISFEGGSEPVWSRDGSQLYFRQGGSVQGRLDRIMVADVSRLDSRLPGTPLLLHEQRNLVQMNPISSYSVSQAGDLYFSERTPPTPEPVTRLEIIQDWRRHVAALKP